MPYKYLCLPEIERGEADVEKSWVVKRVVGGDVRETVASKVEGRRSNDPYNLQPNSVSRNED